MRKSARLGLAVAIVIFLAGLLIWQGKAWLGFGANPLSEEKEREAVTRVVEDFGKKLQKVSLLSPSDMVKKSMEENYKGLVTPELIQEWSRDPAKAPGRLVSSPWPDRIEIASVAKTAADSFKVEGNIIEVTSAEVDKGGAAAKRPISLVVEKAEGRWLITGVTLGGYAGSETSSPSEIVYKNAQYGFTFTLPATWKGYSIVTTTWKGTAVKGPKAGEEIESGPVISIRHPKWMAEKPRQDIPIMVFTISQWNRLKAMEFGVGAAPIPPRELGRNSKYVFALPARYNYAFPEGFEEVEEILKGHPLKAVEKID